MARAGIGSLTAISLIEVAMESRSRQRTLGVLEA
jgi:hypothetical protein